MSGWTEERVERLKALWQDGHSCSQIAKMLGGVTRNAVIGKIHREGLGGRGRPSKPSSSARPLRAAGTSGPRKSPRSIPVNRGGGITAGAIVRRFERADDKKAISLREIPAGPHARHWTERRFGECSWPIGEGVGMLSCCAPVPPQHARKGWCAEHVAIGTNPSKTSAEKLARLFAKVA